MAIPPRTAQSGTFFITTITYNRRRLFQLPANAELFLETLQHYRAEGHYKLHAFVVMPDHVHLLLTPTGKTLSQTMNLIKGGFSHRLPSKFPIWQRGFADHLVADAGHSPPAATTSTRTPSAPTSAKPRKTTPTPPPSSKYVPHDAPAPKSSTGQGFSARSIPPPQPGLRHNPKRHASTRTKDHQRSKRRID